MPNSPQNAGQSTETPPNPIGTAAGPVITVMTPQVIQPQATPGQGSIPQISPADSTVTAQAQPIQPVPPQPAVQAQSQPMAPAAQTQVIQPATAAVIPSAAPSTQPAAPVVVMQQPTAVAAPAPQAAAPTKAYSYNSQTVRRNRHSVRYSYILPVVTVGLIIVGMYWYWQSVGSPTRLEDFPFVQFLLKQ